MIQKHDKQIAKLADFLNRCALPNDLSERLLPKITANQETALLALLWAAAICHATKGGLSGTRDGNMIKGFDFLLWAFIHAANTNPVSIGIARMKTVHGDELKRLLEEQVEEANVQLADLDRRAEILRQLATEIETLFGGKLMTLLDQTAGQLAGTNGFYALMRKFSVFQDEQAKKSSVFLHCLEQSQRWTPIDPENALPMVDYHIIRLFLRTGCLVITEPELRDKLRNKQEVTSEEERIIREAAKDIRISLSPLLSSPLRGELLYHFARSYCRNTPVCVPGNLPENRSFDQVTDHTFTGVCPLQAWCPGCTQSEVRALWEPIIQTENY